MNLLALQLLVFCWGRCGGWGFREEDTGEVPCDVPGCLRERRAYDEARRSKAA